MTEERILGFYEAYCQKLYEHCRGTGVVMNVARTTGPVTPDLVREALFHLQKKHPMLQGQVAAFDDRYDRLDFEYYGSRTDEQRLADIPLEVLAREDDDHWERVAGLALDQPLEDHSSYHWRVTMLAGAQKQELFFFVGHVISDALSSTALLKDVVAWCGARASGETSVLEPLPLYPSVEALVVRPEKSEEPAACAPEQPASWPYMGCAPLERRKPVVVFRQIRDANLKNLLGRCKARGVTINSALGAGLLMAQAAKSFPASSKNKVLFITAINLRGYCQPPVGNEHFGCYVACVNTHHELGDGKDFWDLAREYGDSLKQSIQNAEQDGFLPLTYDKQELTSEIHKGIEKGMETKCFPESPIISNLGRLPFERNHGPCTLEDVYFGTKQMAGDCGIVLSVVTMNNRLSCCFTICDPIISQEQTEAIADHMLDLIRTAE